MAEDEPLDQISRIEPQLEELAEVADRCRKIIVVTKGAIAVGAGLMLVIVLGLLGFDRVAAIGSIAAVLGGIVSLGSNISQPNLCGAASRAGAKAAVDEGAF